METLGLYLETHYLLTWWSSTAAELLVTEITESGIVSSGLYLPQVFLPRVHCNCCIAIFTHINLFVPLQGPMLANIIKSDFNYSIIFMLRFWVMAICHHCKKWWRFHSQPFLGLIFELLVSWTSIFVSLSCFRRNIYLLTIVAFSVIVYID